MRTGEAGQATALVALLLAVLCGAAALTVDVGRGFAVQARLQDAADAAALAGASLLPVDPAGARALALAYARANGLRAPAVSVAPSDLRVTVRAERTLPTTFARLLGVPSLTVGAVAQAAALAVSCAGGPCGPASSPGSSSGTGPGGSGSGSGSVPGGSGSGGGSGTGSAGSSAGSSSSGGTSSGQGSGSGSGGGAGSLPPACPEVAAPGGPACVPWAPGQFGLAPWDVAEATVAPFVAPGGCAWSGDCPPVALMVGAGYEDEGDFGALALGGPGAARYEDNIVDGAPVAVSIGESLPTEPGDIHGPTCQGVAQRLADGAPYVVVPVVTAPAGGGRTEVTVVGFAAFEIGACGTAEGAAQVSGRFVAAAVPGLGAPGTADPSHLFGLTGPTLLTR
jgi:Flp pilus assembly protein TadG